MNSSPAIAWEDRLTRFALALLVLAVAYGIAAGAVVTMYYDVVPDMGSVGDRLGSPLMVLYLLAVIVSLIHMPLAVRDLRLKLWNQAAIRTMVGIAPLFIFLGAEGLVAHFLFWGPISDTGRYHILHHSLVAGAPLTFVYWLALRRWWRPETFSAASSLSLRSWLIGGIVLVWILTILSILLFGISPKTFAGIGLGGLIGLVFVWRMPR